MSKDRNLDHEFLDLRAEDQADRTFLGGMTLARRTRLFAFAGAFVLAALAALLVHVDRNVAAALDGSSAAGRLADVAAQIENGIAGARGEEKRFLLEKDPILADGFERSLAVATKALDKLQRMAAAVPVRQHIDTVRDGLVQYDQHFNKLMDSERALGLSDGTGMSGKLKAATEDIRAKFATAGYANLAGQVARINQEGQETLLSGYKVGIEEIQKRYRTLAAFLKETKIPAKTKAELGELLQLHETNLLAMINARFAFEEESARFDEILAYLQPSLSALGRFSATEGVRALESVAEVRRTARVALAGGVAASVLALLAAGLVLMGGANAALRRVASAAGRLADGDRGVVVPGRGNSDSLGVVARALDRWIDNLADLDHLRQELDHTRARLEKALADADADAVAAADAARAALLSADDEDDEYDELEAAPGRGGRYGVGLAGDDAPAGGGPISFVSRQLASFSQYVTAAAADVERTETLIKGLDDARREIEDMGLLVTSIRDQTNLLAFRSGARDGGADNVVALSGDERGGDRAGDGDASDADMARRFDAIRDATDRAERTALSVRKTLADVTRLAQEIAATASEQALEATSKLLSQSEYLQNMLDDVISKIYPAEPGDMTEGKPASKKPPRPRRKGGPPAGPKRPA